MLRVLLVLALVPLLSGCLAAAGYLAADEMGKGMMGKGERRQATLAALGDEGKDLVARHIEIENVKKADGMESWTAETVNGDYRCTVVTGRSDATCSKMN